MTTLPHTLLSEQDIREALRPLYQNDEAFDAAMAAAPAAGGEQA